MFFPVILPKLRRYFRVYYFYMYGTIEHKIIENVTEILENAVAEKPIVGCREGTPGDRTDGVDLVEESPGLAIDLDHRIPEFFEDPIRKGGGSRSATREGQG